MVRDWYEQATVRTEPRRVLSERSDAEHRLFPEHLMPYVSHEAVRDLPEAAMEFLAAHHLYRYLNFTTLLEMRVVNPVATLIAENRLPVEMTSDDRLGALKIYCDEAYHALGTFDAVQQVVAVTGIPDPGYDFTPFHRRLETPANGRGLRELARLLQVVVFETVITSMMRDIPQDPKTLPFVRDVVRDHARDEAVHHAYFSALFRELWARLDTSGRAAVAGLLPQVITACLQPDLAPVLTSLRQCGLSDSTARAVVEDVYSAELIRASTRQVARHTIKLAEATGVLEVPGAREGFAAAGLIEDHVQ